MQQFFFMHCRLERSMRLLVCCMCFMKNTRAWQHFVLCLGCHSHQSVLRASVGVVEMFSSCIILQFLLSTIVRR